MSGGRAKAERLSPRIEAAIKRTEQENEILISWVQAALVTLLGALYFASPKAFAADVQFEPVPAVLAVYAPLVALRVFLAHRRLLGPWLLTVSVLADVLTLIALIWSFHLQYGQSPAFYLKAPTFAYVFIFIALRSLRYDTRYLVLTGASAIAGWLLLVAYALFIGHARITRDFVHYVMGYEVLLGAEIDKVVSIALVTAVLTVGVKRSRRLLAIATYESQARRELTRFFSPGVADHIVDARDPIRPGQGELRSATSLMIDLRGFTKLASRVDPSTLMAVLADYQKRMVACLFDHGGSVDKFLGDGIMAHFGAATPSATHAADALRSIEALVAEGDRWAAEGSNGVGVLSIGIGCAAGQIVFGAVGDEDRLEYTVIGDAVNLSAKLEKHTKKARVRALVTRGTYELALAQGYQPPHSHRHIEMDEVEGVAGSVDLVVVDEGAAARSSMPTMLSAGEQACM